MSEQGGTPKFPKGIISESLISRVKGIILKPAAEWPQIEAEATNQRAIYVQYVAPLAAIGAIAYFIGLSIVGVTVPFLGTYRTPVLTGIICAAIIYALEFAGVFLVTLIVDAFATTFGGQKDSLRALKVTAYSLTAGWIGAVFNIVPSLAWVGALAGLYGIYLLYLGLPVLMRSPKEKALGYTAVVTLAAIVVLVVLGAIGERVAGSVGYRPFGAGVFGYHDSGKETAARLTALFGGKSEADRQRVAESLESLAKIGERVEKKVEKATREEGDKEVALGEALGAIGRIASGGRDVKPVDFRALKDLLPESLPGDMKREGVSGERNEALGFAASKVEAHYSDGEDKRVTIEITDMGSLSGLAELASKFDPDLDKETDDGYERTRRVNGQLMHEEYDTGDKSGEVAFIAANRFAISVKGENVSMDELTAAFEEVDLDELSELAQAEAD